MTSPFGILFEDEEEKKKKSPFDDLFQSTPPQDDIIASEPFLDTGKKGGIAKGIASGFLGIPGDIGATLGLGKGLQNYARELGEDSPGIAKFGGMLLGSILPLRGIQVAVKAGSTALKIAPKVASFADEFAGSLKVSKKAQQLISGTIKAAPVESTTGLIFQGLTNPQSLTTPAGIAAAAGFATFDAFLGGVLNKFEVTRAAAAAKKAQGIADAAEAARYEELLKQLDDFGPISDIPDPAVAMANQVRKLIDDERMANVETLMQNMEQRVGKKSLLVDENGHTLSFPAVKGNIVTNQAAPELEQARQGFVLAEQEKGLMQKANEAAQRESLAFRQLESQGQIYVAQDRPIRIVKDSKGNVATVDFTPKQLPDNSLGTQYMNKVLETLSIFGKTVDWSNAKEVDDFMVKLAKDYNLNPELLEPYTKSLASGEGLGDSYALLQDFFKGISKQAGRDIIIPPAYSNTSRTIRLPAEKVTDIGYYSDIPTSKVKAEKLPRQLESIIARPKKELTIFHTRSNFKDPNPDPIAILHNDSIRKGLGRVASCSNRLKTGYEVVQELARAVDPTPRIVP